MRNRDLALSDQSDHSICYKYIVHVHVYSNEWVREDKKRFDI